VLVDAHMGCAGNNSKSADFTSGCQAVPAHIEKQEVECAVGKWVNIAASTKMGSSGKLVTQAQVCATVGMVPANANGKVCASGERPARQGNGWETIIYKYGLKGGGNDNDGGEKLETYTKDVARNPGMHYGSCSSCAGPAPTPVYNYGTMCYDRSMGAKNNTQQDDAIAVYCK
jgi:hypothetical protein